MNVKRIFLLGTAALLLFQNQVNAYTEKEMTEYTNGFVKEIQANISEENIILDSFTKDIEINGKMYAVESVEREKTKENIKTETIQKTEVLNTKSDEKIKQYFGETHTYKDEKFKGELPLTNIEIKVIDQGSYEEIDEKRIEFNGYSQNDLNEIAKEKQINNITYYLINVDWKVENSETVDNQQVPTSYKGTMIYQTVLTKKNPSKYKITVTYAGDVERVDTIYKYSVFYKPVEEIVEETEDNVIVPIIISGVGIGLLVILLLSNYNVKIYNKTDNGYKLIGKFKITNKNKVIDITKYQYKVSSNMYSLKLKKSLYRKMKDKLIFIQIKNIKKQVYVNTPYMEILI